MYSREVFLASTEATTATGTGWWEEEERPALGWQSPSQQEETSPSVSSRLKFVDIQAVLRSGDRKYGRRIGRE